MKIKANSLSHHHNSTDPETEETIHVQIGEVESGGFCIRECFRDSQTETMHGPYMSYEEAEQAASRM